MVQELGVALSGGLIAGLITATAGFVGHFLTWRSTQRTLQSNQEIEDRRAQAEALDSYLNEMSKLAPDLPEDDRDDNNWTKEQKRAVQLAQARTMTILLSVTQDRKRIPLTLVRQMNLITAHSGYSSPLVYLKHASLDHANLNNFTLSGVDLRGVDLRAADLRGADLRGSILAEANLMGADLRGTVMGNDPDNDPGGADLRGADLRDADLRDADLRGAHLEGATGVTNEKLKQQARSLEGAIMPNGRRYED